MATNQVRSLGVRPSPRRWGGRAWRSAAGLVGALGLCWALKIGFNAAPFWSSACPVPPTVEVDRGDVAEIVVEYGTLESSDDDVVRCQVESFLGLPIAPAFTGRARGVESQGATNPGGRTPAAGSAAAGSFPNTTMDVVDSSTAANRPLIRSFDYVVEPHIPLRSTLSDQGVIANVAPAPPTILSILPEGSRVKAGDVVCELDSSAFRDALQAQRIRFARAKAWVEQANHILEANEIAFREYANGILPQDIALVRDHIRICETEKERTERNLDWSRTARAKGFRTEAQVDADAAASQQAGFVLRDAECMLKRLVNYTGRRILKARTAKIEAIHADLLSLESSFKLETDRLKRIEVMIANCTMRAPRDGVVVHANRVNSWGTVEMQIREGLTVYQSQPIFRLLDPRHLRVRATINESQVARVRSGQSVMIHLEAFPNRPLRGTVAEIMPVSSLTKGPFSDVRSYFATVRIDSGGFDELRMGLTAELEFLIDSRHQVPRVPLEAVRSCGDQTFAAIATPAANGADWMWTPIALGVTDTMFAEIVSGLKPGDRVIAHSESLPPMELGTANSKTMISDLALKDQNASR